MKEHRQGKGNGERKESEKKSQGGHCCHLLGLRLHRRRRATMDVPCSGIFLDPGFLGHREDGVLISSVSVFPLGYEGKSGPMAFPLKKRAPTLPFLSGS